MSYVGKTSRRNSEYQGDVLMDQLHLNRFILGKTLDLIYINIHSLVSVVEKVSDRMDVAE